MCLEVTGWSDRAFKVIDNRLCWLVSKESGPSKYLTGRENMDSQAECHALVRGVFYEGGVFRANWPQFSAAPFESTRGCDMLHQTTGPWCRPGALMLMANGLARNTPPTTKKSRRDPQGPTRPRLQGVGRGGLAFAGKKEIRWNCEVHCIPKHSSMRSRKPIQLG